MKNLIYVFLIAILPIVELRGAVPVGAILGNDPFLNALAATLGNLLPVPFILLFIPKILDLLERVRFLAPIVRWVRRKADKHKGKIIGEETASAVNAADISAVTDSVTESDEQDDLAAAKKQKRGAAAAFWGLLVFVLIPLPGTGAWTGSLIASLFDMPFRRALPAVILGVLGCAVIMSLASYGVVGFLSFLAK